MELLFLPEAEEDVRAALFWYAQEAAGLEVGFLSALDSCLERISEHPRGFPIVDGDLRRALVRPFPYGVFYVDDSSAVIVVGCIHTSRDPEAWKPMSLTLTTTKLCEFECAEEARRPNHADEREQRALCDAHGPRAPADVERLESALRSILC